MELDCGEESGSGLALLPIKNDLDRLDPLEARNSRIFDVHVSRLANAFGISITTSIIKDQGDDGRHQSKRHRTCHTNRDGSCSIDEKEILHKLRERNYEILLQ